MKMKLINGWKKIWSKGSGKKYGINLYKYNKKGQNNMQIAKYRSADKFDKYMENKYKWHGKWYGKWYVNLYYPEKIKLFNTKTQAMKFALNYMKKH